MERITKHEGRYISINGCKSRYLNEERPGAPASNAIVRLAAYEDKGLLPEEITTEPYGCVFYCNRKCNLNDDFCAEGPGCPWELSAEAAKHLLELSQAEQDGRLASLPCKVGDTVSLLLGDGAPYMARVQGISVSATGKDTILHFRGYPSVPVWGSDVGKTWVPASHTPMAKARSLQPGKP